MNLATIEISDAGSGQDKEKKDRDLLPEYCHYRDEGCELADSCLSCPFPRCIYEEPRGKQRWLKELRNKEIGRLFDSGCGTKALGVMFGLSRRTIQRALKNTTSRISSKFLNTEGSRHRTNRLSKGENSADE